MSKGWTVAIQALGAMAGLGLLATFVGGAMLWLRFDALDLPADRAVALLPKELLAVVGAHALVIPLLIGLAAALAVLLIAPWGDHTEQEQRQARGQEQELSRGAAWGLLRRSPSALR